MHEYPETSDGNMLLKKESTGKELPIDCMRVMLQKTRACPRAKINDPQDAANLMREMGDYERERGVILHLDTKNNVIGVENISIGSLNAAIIHPREALKGAILNSAAHVIFLHNHPSGDKAPSTEDRAITKKLMGAFDSVGIDLLDSIIVGRETYYSFKETGEMFPESKYKESRLGEMRFMDNKDEMYEDIGKNEEDACSIATRAALEVVSERCGREDGTVNDALGAAKASLDHLSSKGKFVFFRDIQKIHRTGEGWEVEIDSTMFAGTLEVAPDGKTKILTGGEL